MSEPPSHHSADGRYRNPWRAGREPPLGQADLLKWAWERFRQGRAPDPDPGELPRGTPAVAESRVDPESEEVRITWVGHATFLIQLPGVTVLTDPTFSRRASPVQWMGPRRFSPPGIALDALPAVDAVVLSHDHYDHLDAGSVKRLRDRFGDALTWYTPLGYRDWLSRRGVERVEEMDWWETRPLGGPSAGSMAGAASPGRTARGGAIRALPARHWTRRRLFDARRRLWCSWSIEVAGRRIFFGGDSAYCPVFSEIGERAGPFDVALLPVGAYEPRWFMKSSHMNPEEAVQACHDMGAGAMVGMHWGTFRLTDEPPLEPPVRTRAAWSALGGSPSDLYIPALGETLSF